ncbi:hypothetical protein IQ265_03490 [Nodosilinea sp. LEGE 06152]|nr:hypothetical protein [Nodosilinea sp. LEGE 06152]MBE9155897.1 hypothetical protein [Nodosilinea sp. LEGE 06152]
MAEKLKLGRYQARQRPAEADVWCKADGDGGDRLCDRQRFGVCPSRY